METEGRRGREKLSKEEKKANKRTNKARVTLFKRDGVHLSSEPTVHLVIGNGGLDNNINRDDLLHIFEMYGEIVDITMEKGKSYSYVSYARLEDAKLAMQNVHGRELKPATGSVPALHFYLSFVAKVPGVEVPDDQLPSGLILLENFITTDEEQLMLRSIDWDSKDANSTADGKENLKHRRVKHYGYEFLYRVNNVDRSRPLEHGIPEWSQPVIDRLLAGGHIASAPDQLTVNQYSPGQGIPPHVDTHSAFEDGICALTLGSQIVMEFRHPGGEHRAVVLPRRSMLVMRGESRYLWTHGITPRKSDVVRAAGGLTLIHRDTRTSLTFRRILHSPCNCSFPDQCDSQQDKLKKQKESVSDSEKDREMPSSALEAEKLEGELVHKVYEEIAEHFSDTRHSPWPLVAQFLQHQPEGALITDVGCGNGKYLSVNKNAFQFGCDRSFNLCSICHDRGFPVFVCDCLRVPIRSDSQDVVISIAVIHHLSTTERRLEAIKELVRILRVGGQGLVYVWAMEQKRNNIKSKYLKGKGVEDTDNFEISKCAAEPKQNSKQGDIQTDEGLCRDLPDGHSECSDLEQTLSDKFQNKLRVHTNRTEFESQDLLVPWHLKEKSSKQSESQCFHRYYHVFTEGEIEELMSDINNIRIIKSYYDQGNWCVIFEKVL